MMTDRSLSVMDHDKLHEGELRCLFRPSCWRVLKTSAVIAHDDKCIRHLSCKL
jgi:hypothetical protein